MSAKISEFDPDVLVGHNFMGFDLDVLLHRMQACAVPTWSKLGRLRLEKFVFTIMLIVLAAMHMFTYLLDVIIKTQDAAITEGSWWRRRVNVGGASGFERPPALRYLRHCPRVLAVTKELQALHAREIAA
jgi:hypothetical protein